MKALLTIALATFISARTPAQMKGLMDDIRGQISGSETIDYEKLIDLFSDMIKQHPDVPSGYNNLGAAKIKMQDYAGALQSLNKAIELSPHYPEALYNRGVAKFFTKDYKGAVQDFKTASTIDTRDAAIHYNIALAEYYAGNKTGAINALDQTLKLKGDFEWALCNRGVINNEMEKHDEAVKDLSGAIAINPKDGDYFCNRGQAYLKLGNTASACNDFSKASELGSEKAKELAGQSCR